MLQPAAADALGLLLADLAQAGLVRHHMLGPLAAEEAAVLLADLLGGVGKGAVAERVLQRAGGTPFYLVSYAQALRQGSVEAVPWDLAQGVCQRVALLPEVAQGVLGAAAIVGRRVPRALLAAATGQGEEVVLAGLETACRARLLLEEGDEAYAFAHDVIREVVEARAVAGIGQLYFDLGRPEAGLPRLQPVLAALEGPRRRRGWRPCTTHWPGSSMAPGATANPAPPPYAPRSWPGWSGMSASSPPPPATLATRSWRWGSWRRRAPCSRTPSRTPRWRGISTCCAAA